MNTATITLKSSSQQTIPFFFDEDGFLFDPSTWTQELAREIARLDDLGQLTKDHWSIIEYLRDHYFRFGAMPLMRRVCRANNLKADAVKQLFGSCRALWRVAGLPNPGEEAKAYMI
jgi:tRNA 2-thiouridine synthesizing protein E